MFSEIQRLFCDNAAAMINANLWFNRAEAAAVIAVAQMVAVQPLRDICVRQSVIGEQGGFAKQLNLLVFLIFHADIFRAVSIQA